MHICTACPRKCGKERLSTEGHGICGMPSLPKIARAAVHFGEEPCISGANGSGTVFFSGCSLKCVFCQNDEISRLGFGKTISVEALRKIYFDLKEQGVHNINLVNPSHYTDVIAKSLEEPIGIPVVYNSGGYDDVESLKRLEGKIQVYMPDMKYSLNAVAQKYSGAKDYFEVADKAIKEMYRQTGDYILDQNGILQKGVLIRHLILPENTENTLGVIDWVKDSFNKNSVLFSLMSQYTPIKTYDFSELNRGITKEEYEAAESYMYLVGIKNGYVQELSSATKDLIPDFDLTGVQADE